MHACYLGLIELPKAARGHATYVDSEIQHVTKNWLAMKFCLTTCQPKEETIVVLSNGSQHCQVSNKSSTVKTPVERTYSNSMNLAVSR